MLVDTSVWIDFFNAHDSHEAQLLAALIADGESIEIPGIVLVELLSGFVATLRQSVSLICWTPSTNCPKPPRRLRRGGADLSGVSIASAPTFSSARRP